MKSVAAKSGLKVRSWVKAGALTCNHNRGGLKVKAGVKAGALTCNHNRGGLKVKAGIRAGYTLGDNHSRTFLR